MSSSFFLFELQPKRMNDDAAHKNAAQIAAQKKNSFV
jgi:hypothetical protein